MITGVRLHLIKLLIMLSLLLLRTMTALAQDLYEKNIETWRSEREAKLKADDGWLTVSGLFWLREGANNFGINSNNDIVLPQDSWLGFDPDTWLEKIGVLELNNSKVTLRIFCDSNITVNGKRVKQIELQSDRSGKPDIIRIGDLSLSVLKRGERFAIRLKDKCSRARREFSGLRWYPVKEEYRITAQFIAYEQPKEFPIINVLGDVEKYKSPGVLKFKLNGQEYTLQPVSSGDDELFIIFRDLTSNKTTYAASRFIYTGKPKDGQVVLDFNQAINPPCAFTNYATCPLPPRQNYLGVAIEAGELIYHGLATTLATAPGKK